MATHVLLQKLEDDGYCSTYDIERNYSLSKTVQNDGLRRFENDVLNEKVKDIVQSFAVSTETINSIYYGLLMGNVILEGPPGTGKTTLVREVCKKLFNVKLEEATANIEWTVYDLVGRKTLDIKEGKEAAVPEDGYITRSIVDCCKQISLSEEDSSQPQATWLLIDEINRCKIDRAFGEFFTVLSGNSDQKLTLPHQTNSNRLLYVPSRFRIVGTMNSTDKSFVNSFSQAFARRFHFVNVDIPRTSDLVEKEAEISLSVAIKEIRAILDIAESLVQAKADEERVKTAMNTINDFFRLVRFGKQSFPGIIPLGTAQLIDVKKALLLKLLVNTETDIDECINWALNVKLLNQFDSSNITEEDQVAFIEAIPDNLKGFKKNVQAVWGFYEESEV